MLKRNGKIAARDDQLSLFDFGSFNGQRDLPDTIGPMAARHWREFRPKMVRDLETRGILMETLLEAETTISEMETLTRQLETEQKLSPQQAHDQDGEMIREKYILLPAEEGPS